MTKDRWKTVTSIVDLILEAKPGDQQKIIDNECGHDPELIREVKKFLFSIENSESLWDDLLKSNKILANELTESGALLDDTTTSFIPEQIGVYKLIRLIARGGMGDVFLAERNDGQFKRTVALKILRRELISENYTQRFITEREILSSLDHPNIARLYDGGFTNDGRPYLVMEYIDGEPITSFCTRNECSAEKKLDLFIQICQAVHYAHTNLIVHRDLKPDNIFVTTGGVVKILDFGIAKILDTELSPEMLVQTSTGSRLFSVQYAAPEQITLDKITTSTDVYALGLILYEIITGSKPNNLEAKNLKKAENLIRFQSPESPSRVVANKQLSKKLRGDLDSIILKALRKEPEHRYATVDLLLNDIKRYQHHLPVLAKSGSIKYRCQKFTKRHKLPLFLTAFILACITGFLIYHITEINKQKEIALAGEQEATFVTNFMIDLFKSASPTENIKDTLTVFDLLKRGKNEIANLDVNFASKRKILSTLAESYSNLGNYDEAQELYLEAIEILKNSDGEKAQLAELAYKMGSMHSSRRSFENAANFYDHALQIIESLPYKEPEMKADILSGYANAIAELGNSQLAILFLEESMKLNNTINRPLKQFRNAKINLAKAYRHNLEYERSEKLYREILREMDESETIQEIDKAPLYNNFAYLLKVQGKNREAILYYQNSHQLLEKVYGDESWKNRVHLLEKLI